MEGAYTEGPYRDLGSGFARLTGVEGARRGPSRIAHVEDALIELLRNARDAGARNVYVATTLKNKRYRSLTVLDDGRGIPDSHKSLVFEPGVTTRHLDPVPDPGDPKSPPHGAGLSLYHIKNAALSAGVPSASSPTSIKVTFDTHAVPERTLQSETRPSRTNLLATVQTFARKHQPGRQPVKSFYGPPARILATLLDNHIIQLSGSGGRAATLRGAALGVGLEVSLRTVQRVLRGEIRPVGVVSPAGGTGGRAMGEGRRREDGGGPVLVIGNEERAQVADILRRAARAGYLDIEDIRLETRPGEISIRARVYEPEEEYE